MSDDSTLAEASVGGARYSSMLDASRERLVYWVATAVLFGVLVFVGWRYVGTAVLGLFVYYVTRPVFRRLNARVGPRTLAVVVALLTVALPVLLLVVWTAVVAVQALSGTLATDALDQFKTLLGPYVDFTGIADDATALVRGVVSDPTRLGELRLDDVGGTALSVLRASLVTLFNAGLHLFIVVVIAFYLLRDDHRIARWARTTLAPEGSVTEAYVLAVDRDLEEVYFGNILNALVTGLLGVVTYLALDAISPPGVGIPQPALLGLLVGAASLIPVVGMKIVWIPMSLFLFGVSLVTAPETVWFPTAFALVSVVVVDYIPDQLLRPYVSGRSLHVGAVMLAYILGPLLFGWYGIFFGPLVLVVVFEFGRVVLPWLVDGDSPTVDAPVDRTEPPSEDAARPADGLPEGAGGDDDGRDRPADPTDGAGTERIDDPSGE